VTRPLRFLLLTTFYPPYSFGGDAICVSRLAHALADEGHQIDVIHCVDSYRLLDPTGQGGVIEERQNLRVHSLRSGHGFLSPFLSHQTGWPFLKQARIQEILDRSRPDVIHYHNISLFGPGILTLGLEGGTGALKFYTTHEYWLICPTHVLWKFNRRACEKPQCLQCTVMAGRPPQLWRYTEMRDRCASEVDVFLSPSRFAAELHLQRGFSRPMTYLPPFVDIVEANTQIPPSPHPRPYFLFVGRLEAFKGVRSLVEAWGKTSEVDLLIAGDGSQVAELKKLAAGNPRITFLGLTTQQALGPLYANCLACIVPSLMYEVFTTVVLEAFARKAPVIARDHGPFPEIINESRGGLLYRSEEELLASVKRLARNFCLRTQLGENGFRMVTNRWSKEAHLKAYFALIRENSLRKFGRIPWEE
jgi:glycosyltransferase involved in cell wall biosynthesis